MSFGMCKYEIHFPPDANPQDLIILKPTSISRAAFYIINATTYADPNSKLITATAGLNYTQYYGNSLYIVILAN